MSKRLPHPRVPRPQVIEEDGRPAFAVLPWKDWESITDALEDSDDLAAAEAFRADLATGRVRTVPGEVATALLAGDETPLRVIRRWRGLTQAALAGQAGLKQAYVSEIENGKKTPSVEALRALARALEVDLELLLPPED